MDACPDISLIRRRSAHAPNVFRNYNFLFVNLIANKKGNFLLKNYSSHTHLRTFTPHPTPCSPSPSPSFSPALSPSYSPNLSISCRTHTASCFLFYFNYHSQGIGSTPTLRENRYSGNRHHVFRIRMDGPRWCWKHDFQGGASEKSMVENKHLDNYLAVHIQALQERINREKMQGY